MPPTTPSAATAAAAAAHFILPSLLLQISVVATDVSASSRGVVLDTLPTLQWPVPREWLNVKTGCSSAVGASATAAVGAVGDGTADDTAAIQACFDMVSNESQHLSVYIPAGTYKVTKTLRLFRGLGILLVGQGEPSRLVWGGEYGGTMLVSDGLSRSRFVGLVFDGQDSAAVGFEHDSHSPGLFETRIRHQNNKYINLLTAGIRIGHNRTGHKLETSEVLYENSVFANIGNQDSVAFNCTRGVVACGGVAILNFNDYDNTFDGCHFYNNSWGITSSAMANMYVRNSRFENNGFKFQHRVGPAVYVYEGADIALAKSAGASVRRCVSVNSTRFVVSPGSGASSPTTIEGNVIDSWRGHAAITGDLRGPYLLLDNMFTNGTGSVPPYDPRCNPDDFWCGVPMAFSPWHTTNAWTILAGNTINGKAVTSEELLPCADDRAGHSPTAHSNQRMPKCSTQTNLFKRDLQVSAPTMGLNSESRFLKSHWPVPTSLVDARDHGCTGTETDSTACVQATIDAAAAKGAGTAAYFAARSYSVSKPIHITAGNYTVLGSGFKTQFVWKAAQSADPAVVVVHGAGGKGLRLMHFEVQSGGKAMSFDTKILHDGASAGSRIDSTVPTVSSSSPTLYDEVYTSMPGAGMWNATGVAVRNLAHGDTVHFVHLDGNLLIADSARGTVFLNFMIQGSLNVSGSVQPAPDRSYPSVAAATVVGLTDHDINVMDDQSVVITDYYSEQIKTGHLWMSGSGKSDGSPGRVTISAVKSNCYTSSEITVHNYHGTLVYANSLFFEGPPIAIKQSGTVAVNITLLGNGFNGSSSKEALLWKLDAGGKGRNSAIGNLVPCMNCKPAFPALLYPETTAAETKGGAATTNGTIAMAIDDFRRLGRLDLLLNHPSAMVDSDKKPGIKTDDGAVSVPVLPTLSQTPRSDWLSVKDGCAGGPKARGDGKTDDTKALQACFAAIGNMSSIHTIWMPIGKYIVKDTLVLYKVLGGSVIGDGEGTVLVWAGKKGGNSTLILSDGISRSRMMGFVLDGTAGCDVGIEHHSNNSLFETRIRHQNQKFLGFGQAGIRIGYGGNHPGRKESAEIIYENNIFHACGVGCHGLPFAPMTSTGCGAVAILNFNDYDNVFDGNHFSRNSFGIYNDKMANVYVRNCRFEASTHADVYLAASAGNSIRRSISTGSAQFVAAPARDPGTSNPTVIMDNRIDSWTSPAGAIAYSLRGPVTVFDNEFTNAPAKGLPIQPKPPSGSNFTYWLLSNNLLDGKPAGASELIAAPSNVQVYDLDSMAPYTPSVSTSPLSAKTVFLKPQWPVPTKIYDVTAFGANGSHAGDDTTAIQAAIDAAANAGGGAMAYLPSGTYHINKTLEIKGKNFWVAGCGLKSQLVYTCPTFHTTSASETGVTQCPDDGPALRVSAATNVSVEMMHIAAPSFTDQLLIQGGTGITNVKLDGIYAVNSAINTEKWNGTTTIHIASLAKGETVHAIHLDGNMNVSDSEAGTVLVGMLIESTLHLNGANVDPESTSERPSRMSIGFLTFIGLVDDYDVIVQDDQSLVIEDLYCEQLKTGHIMLSGSGATDDRPPGRVTIQGVKTDSYTPALMHVDNYHGSMFYMSSTFLEKRYPAWEITQTGSATFNLTLMGNDFDSANSDFLNIKLSSKKGYLNLIANSASNFSDLSCGEAISPLTDKISDPSLWLVHKSLDDFRRLGLIDLQLNHPAVWASDGRAGMSAAVA